jgi:hypothetical protein
VAHAFSAFSVPWSLAILPAGQTRVLLVCWDGRSARETLWVTEEDPHVFHEIVFVLVRLASGGVRLWD